MFTTGNHIYLYIAVGFYAVALLLYFMRIRGISLVSLVLGLIIYSLYLIGRGWLGGVFIPNPIFGGPFFLPWCVALLALLRRIQKKDDWGLILIPLLAFSIFILWHGKGIIPPTPKKITLWAVGFFITEVFAHACFYCGALFALIAIIKNRDANTFHSYMIWGFVIFSISQVVGAVWAYLGWGCTFNWGPRHMTTAGIWVMYVAYLHLRFMPEWDARRKAVFSTVSGFVLLFLSFSHYIHEMRFPRIGG